MKREEYFTGKDKILKSSKVQSLRRMWIEEISGTGVLFLFFGVPSVWRL